MNNIVSIVMPAYNCDSFIKQSIESVINQTYKNWELIIINDCSTDKTEEIIKSYSDKRITTYKNNKQKGVSYSRNKGISFCSSEWIAFIDSDDIWENNKLEEQLEIVSNNKEFIFTGSKFINENGKQIKYIQNVPEKININELLKQNLISCSSVLINKKHLINHPFPEGIENIHEDYAAWLEILKDIDYAYGINKPLLTYRIRESSKSFNKIKAAIMNFNVYRYIKLPTFKIIKYMFYYGTRSINKYSYILKSK